MRREWVRREWVRREWVRRERVRREWVRRERVRAVGEGERVRRGLCVNMEILYN